MAHGDRRLGVNPARRYRGAGTGNGDPALSQQPQGSLACVGVGMMLGAHISPRARSYIEQADVVFIAASDPVVEVWVQQMAADVRSLQPYYGDGKSRRDTYREMVDALLAEVTAGKTVCGAFYGHPGVFAQVAHAALLRAAERGHATHMEPGISAEDCLYADLGIDPGRVGCQHYEASQLLFYRRRIDPSAYLVLWQVGLVGDRTYRRSATSVEHRRLLVERLAQDYPRGHEVIAYEAATLPVGAPRAQRVRLADLPSTLLNPHTTLVVPPCRPLERDATMLAALRRLDLTSVDLVPSR